MNVKSPRHSGYYPDRALDCQHALEPLFIALIEADDPRVIDLPKVTLPLIEAGVGAGWTVSDISLAVAELADNYQMKIAENRRTDNQIAKATTIQGHG